MKKIATLLTATALLAGTSAYAGNEANGAANQSNLVVGVIDLSQVLQKSPQMKAAADKLKAQFKPRQEKIIAAQKNLAKDEDKLKRDASVMSQSDVQSLQAKVGDERRDLQRQQEDYMQDIQGAQQQAMQSVLQGVDKIVENIAQQGHFDLILQRNSVAFASPRVDITPQVIAKLK